MASLNRVELIGNLGRDPELKYTPSGQAVATFTVATSRKWKDKDGNPQEDTQWHNIECWGRQAEIAQQYLKKGRQVYIEGRLDTHAYDDKDGNRKWFTRVVAWNFLMLGSKQSDSGGGEYVGAPEPPAGQSQPQPSTSMAQDDDLPF